MEILKVDPIKRRKLFIAYAWWIIALSILLLMGTIFYRTIAPSISLVTKVHLQDLFEGIFLMSIAIPSLFLINSGKKVLKADQYPLETMIQLVDTPIKRGKPAQIIGKRLIFLGIFGLVMISIGTIANHSIHLRFLKNPLSFIHFTIPNMQTPAVSESSNER